jgi:hypothetical protein
MVVEKLDILSNLEIPEAYKLQHNIQNPFQKGTYDYKYVQHFCNGELIQDVSEFIATRKHFEEFGVYTKATPNSHPNSQWMKFWAEEQKRCIDGYNIGRDWIPGYLYFYWNFGRIEKVMEVEGSKKKGITVEGFPDCWDGDYFWFHYIEEAENAGKHACCLKARRKGYSYKTASMFNRNFFLIPGSKCYAIADKDEYLDKDGLITKTWSLMAWLDENTAWTKRRHVKNKDDYKRASYIKKVNGAKIEIGYKSEIMKIVLGGDPNKARGKAGKLAAWEESGDNSCLQNAWGVAQESYRQGMLSRGIMIPFGTGGTEGADFKGLEDMARNPEAYDIHSVPDIYSGNINNRICYFVPDYVNSDRVFQDENGNSKTIEAAIQIDKAKRQPLKKSSKTDAYIRKCAELPFTLDEAILSMQGSPFDVALIRQVLSVLKTKSLQGEPTEFIKDAQGKIKANLNPTLIPINNFPLSSNDNNTEGCWVIYEHPKSELVPSLEGSTLEINPYRYVAGHDPIEFGSEESSDTDQHKRSLASTFIIDSFTRNIVAEYTGRPKITDHYYNSLILGLEYYNAQLLYENNLRGLYAYFLNKNKLYLLAQEPNILKERAGYKSNNRMYGFHTTPSTKGWFLDLINKWSLEEVPIDQNEVTGRVDTVPRMWLIKSIPLLQELAGWTPKLNVDRIMSLGACLLLLTDRERAIETIKTKVNSRFDDKFFRILEVRKNVKLRRNVY